MSIHSLPDGSRSIQARAWIMSDLQHPDPTESARCLSIARTDMESLGISFDQLWYLGDAVVGTNIERNHAVADAQLEIFDEIDLPSRYVLGNHDLDAGRMEGVMESPFYEKVNSRSNWRTIDDISSFYFVDQIGDCTVLFLSDHMAPDCSWSVTHGRIHGDEAAYPYDRGDYQSALARAAEGDQVIIAGHNSFDGGNRPATIQRKFLPLPENVLVHLYGHAHLGDEKCVSPSGKEAYRAISGIDHHQISQIDVASLEDRRGDVIRSAILEIYESGGCGIYLRDHSNQIWLESYHAYAPQQTYQITVRSNGTSQSFDHVTQQDQLQAVTDHLVGEQGLLDRTQLPYHDQESGFTISPDHTMPNGDEMDRPKVLSNGSYVEARMDKFKAISGIKTAASACDCAIEFDGLWIGAER